MNGIYYFGVSEKKVRSEHKCYSSVNLFSSEIVFIRRNLTSVDVRF